MSDKVTVYFTNGKAVKYPIDTVAISKTDSPSMLTALEMGLAVINWDNVCWMKKHEEPKETLDD